MKKLTLLFMAGLVLLLSGCAYKHTDEFKAYRNQSAQKIYTNANIALARGRYNAAIKGYEALDAIYPFSRYSRQAQLNVIYAYYKADKDAEGLAAADRYIRLYPRGPNVDYAFYMKGLVSFRQGMTWLQTLAGVDPAQRAIDSKRTAYSAFSQVVTYFPHSPYAYDSALHMIYVRNVIARHYVQIARVYMERRAYLAAANRASYVVQHFDRSPEVKPALEIMVKAYKRLGLTKMANNSMRLLQTNFPESSKAKRS